MLTQKTAAAIHNCHQQIFNAEKLLTDTKATMDRYNPVDLIDAFGRRQNSLQLGVPSGESSRTILQVDFELAAVIIEAQVLKYKSQLDALNELAKSECLSNETTWTKE